MSKLGKKLRSKPVELVLIAIFLLYSLRVINWFEYPYIIAGGDLRPPLIREAFTSRVLSTWDEIDFGTPSVYSPRILDPFYFFITVSQTFGANLYLAQIIGVFLIYFLGSLFAYVFIKQLANGDTIAGFVGAIFVTSNLHLISDREQTAIGFLDMTLMILPCLVTFTRGINVRSYKLMALSGLLFVLTYGTFPNYRTSLICLIMIALICLYFFVERGVRFRWLENKTTKFLNISFNTELIRTYLRYLCLFIISILLASIWITSLVSMNSQRLATTYNEVTAPTFLKYLKPYDVLRLIAKWSFYEGAFERPYVPYASVYTSNSLMIILSYLPPILAFTSLLVSKRKLTIFFSVMAIISLILTGAFNPGLSQLYSALATNVPLMIAFRESTHWIFFAVLSYAILIGVTVSSFCRKLKNRKLQIVALSLVIALLAYTTYPLITGEVTENWLDPQIKGSYLPLSYEELNDALSNNYWSMLLPARNIYLVYNFTEGPFSSGNPYPLIFSKPIVSGIGTEYLQSENPDLPLYELHQMVRTHAPEGPKFLGMLGIKYLILEKNIVSGNEYSINESELAKDFIQSREWKEVTLYENRYALTKLYAADNLLNYNTSSDLHTLIMNTGWNTLNHSTFINSTNIGNMANMGLAIPESLVWRELSPTSYEARAESRGAFVLILLETYDSLWKLSVNGNTLAEASHIKVNAFANGWLIDKAGSLTIKVEYEAQKLFTASVVASIILPALLILFLCRANLKALAKSVRCKLKRKAAEN